MAAERKDVTPDILAQRQARYITVKTKLSMTDFIDIFQQMLYTGFGRLSVSSNAFTALSGVCWMSGRMPFLPPNHQCQSTEGN